MTRIDTVVIGAGHAGLAVSRLLTVAGCEHVVLDRGRVAERWRSERWDSLHLLSPNWLAGSRAGPMAVPTKTAS
jgi:putative flavoprotein involved in K+ transport